MVKENLHILAFMFLLKFLFYIVAFLPLANIEVNMQTIYAVYVTF